jgi:hypothetical protein
MTTQDEYARQANEQVWREINETIEWDLRADRLCAEDNWTRIKINRFTDNHHAIDMRIWIKDHVAGAHDSHGATFIFERESDAAMFVLRWM